MSHNEKTIPFPFIENDREKTKKDIDGKINSLIGRGAIFFVNHSAGKDSQAMMIKLRGMVPKEQIVVVHAHLRDAEWDGTIDHIKKTTPGYPLHVVEARKSLFEMVRHRGMWPSPMQRQCTSDLKRSQIEKLIRRVTKEKGNGLVVNCMGLRAEESTRRARATVFKFNERNSKAGREWYDWLPIHDMAEKEVFASIKNAGEVPHWAYKAGMTRLSCCFCIMASKSDLRTAATLNPEMYAEVVALEKEVGHTLTMPPKGKEPVYLEDITGISAIPIKEAA